MDDVRLFFAVLVVAFLPPGVAWWFVVHPFVDFWRRIGVHRTMTVMTIAAFVGVAALISIRHRLVLTDYGTHTPLFLLAALLFSVSVWIAIQRRKFLTVKIMAGVPELEEGGEGGELLSDGIYGRIRHPRYVEVVLGTMAYAVFSNYLGAYLVALATIPAVHLIVVLEERELRQRFGERYEQYCQRVPRYVPKRARAPSTA